MKHKVTAHNLAAFETLMKSAKKELADSGEIVTRIKIKMFHDNSYRDIFSAVIWTDRKQKGGAE